MDALLCVSAQNRMPIAREELKSVVATNNKQRFAFDEAGTKIRANQGHSVPIDPELAPAMRPDILYRGRPIVFVVDAGRMHREGHTFFCSENSVWLTDAVPAEFLTRSEN